MDNKHQNAIESNDGKEYYDVYSELNDSVPSPSINDNYNAFDNSEKNSEKMIEEELEKKIEVEPGKKIQEEPEKKIEEETDENNKEEPVKNNKEQPLQNSTEKYLQDNIEKFSKDNTEKSLQNYKEESLQNITEETKKSTEENNEFNKLTINPLNKNNNPINNEKKTQNSTIKFISEKTIYSNNNNKESIEGALNDGNLNNNNQVMIDKTISQKNKLKRKNPNLFKIYKQRGPKTKNEKKRHKHASYYNDNIMDKAGRLFVNSNRCYLNYRFERYGLNKLEKTNFKQLYGSNCNTHTIFLKKTMEDVLNFDSEHNKKIIKKMFDQVKDETSIHFMKLNVEDAYRLYQNNDPHLQTGNCRRYLSHYISLKKAINDKKEKNKNNLDDLNILEEKSQKFIETIYEESKGRTIQKKRYRNNT